MAINISNITVTVLFFKAKQRLISFDSEHVKVKVIFILDTEPVLIQNLVGSHFILRSSFHY